MNTIIEKAPQEWKTVSFKELAKERSSRVDNPGESGYEIYVGLEHLDSDSLIVKRHASTKDVTSSMKLFKKGDILFARRNTYLRRCSVAAFDGVCSGDIIVLQPILSHIIEGFLPILMQFEPLENRIISLSAGAFSKRIKWRQLAEERIPIPSKEEQQKIVEAVWSIQDNIQKTEKLIEITETLKQGLLNELLTKGIGHTQFKDSELGKIPEEWEVVKLEDICTFFDHMRVPIKESDRAKRHGPYPYYGAQSIIDWIDEYNFDGSYLLIAEDGENLKSKVLPIAYQVSGKFWVNNHAHVIKPKDNTKIIYLEYVLNFIDIKKYLIGSAQPKLNQNAAKKIKIPLPSLEEQNKIVEISMRSDENIKSYISHKCQLNSLKKKLTNELLLGKIRV